MVRLADWEARLADYLAAQREGAFVWGRRDCVLFAAGAIAAMTGEDPAVHVRKRYRTRIGAMRKLHAEGARTIAELVGRHLEEVPIGHARRGDLAMARGSLGVVAGRSAWFVGEHSGAAGLVAIDIAEWERAWRVPFG